MYYRIKQDNDEQLYKKYTNSAWKFARKSLEYEKHYNDYIQLKTTASHDIIETEKIKLINESNKLEKHYDIYALYLDKFYKNDYNLV